MDAKKRSGDLISENEKDVRLSRLRTFWWWRGSGGSSRLRWTMKIIHKEDEYGIGIGKRFEGTLSEYLRKEGTKIMNKMEDN